MMCWKWKRSEFYFPHSYHLMRAVVACLYCRMKVSGYECGYPVGRAQGLADGFATGFTQGVQLAQEVFNTLSDSTQGPREHT
jgi:hypothetical protein